MKLGDSFTFDDVAHLVDANQIEFLLDNASGAGRRPDLVTAGVIAETFFEAASQDVLRIPNDDERRYFFDFESTVDSKVYEIKCLDTKAFRRNKHSDELMVFYRHFFQLDAWHDDEKRHWYNGLKPRFVFFSRTGDDALVATYKCEAIIPFCEMIVNITADHRKRYTHIAPNRQIHVGV